MAYSKVFKPASDEVGKIIDAAMNKGVVTVTHPKIARIRYALYSFINSRALGSTRSLRIKNKRDWRIEAIAEDKIRVIYRPKRLYQNLIIEEDTPTDAT